jgi:hypothetical protein
MVVHVLEKEGLVIVEVIGVMLVQIVKQPAPVIMMATVRVLKHVLMVLHVHPNLYEKLE